MGDQYSEAAVKLGQYIAPALDREITDEDYPLFDLLLDFAKDKIFAQGYDQFWYGDVWLAKVYRDAEELRKRRANTEAWRNGFYMASALSSTVGNMFRKKGSSPIKYMDRPIPLTQKEKDEYEYQRAVEAQERIKRMMFSMMESDGGSDG